MKNKTLKSKKENSLLKFEIVDAVDYFRGHFSHTMLKSIDEWSLQFIGESFKNFKHPIEQLPIDLPISTWFEAAKNSPRHGNIHEVALRKIEVEIYYKVKPSENIEYSLDPDGDNFKVIDQSTFGLEESNLVYLFEELKLLGRVIDERGDSFLRRYKRPVVEPITWGNSFTQYWRAFPTAMTLYAVACALYRINEGKYETLLANAEEFLHENYKRYYYQMMPETGP